MINQRKWQWVRRITISIILLVVVGLLRINYVQGQVIEAQAKELVNQLDSLFSLQREASGCNRALMELWKK